MQCYSTAVYSEWLIGHAILTVTCRPLSIRLRVDASPLLLSSSKLKSKLNKNTCTYIERVRFLAIPARECSIGVTNYALIG